MQIVTGSKHQKEENKNNPTEKCWLINQRRGFNFHRPLRASVAQLVERRTCNAEVGGSSPLSGSFFINNKSGDNLITLAKHFTPYPNATSFHGWNITGWKFNNHSLFTHYYNF